MRILIDIGHPGHVHLFRNAAQILQKKGHKIFFTLREKEKEIELLKAGGFEYKSFGKKYNTTKGKIYGMLKFGLMETLTALKFKPDLFFSHGSIYASHAAAILRKPNIAMEDTGNLEQVRLYRPFTKIILSPAVIGKNLGSKHYLYNSIHEIAYLHPRYFTPDPSIYKLLELEPGAPYAILRFISWNATHDVGQVGLTYELKKELVNILKKRMKVFISSENKNEPEFAEYMIKIPPEKMHDALAFASIYIGEGTTMAAEASILGTPSFYVSTVKGQNCEELEQYGLGYVFTNADGLLQKVNEVINTPELKVLLQERVKKYLADKIDLTAFMVWVVENYPGSIKTLRQDKNYHLQFPG
ncbi:MAG: DUF354 domain-containing protein [Sphingobacteriales bacterium]|nr:DUF354 domain-containing protein [Sphingobacteriales bacterium]MBI3720844.1 DUF354 domain-containing protein [Sphingobacteriales bacterium]